MKTVVDVTLRNTPRRQVSFDVGNAGKRDIEDVGCAES
jgi:hypothetical protein